MADTTESLAIKGSKGLIVAVITALLAGGGLGASAVGAGVGRDATAMPTPYLSRTEIESVASKAADRAEERASAVAMTAAARAEAAAKQACDTRLEAEIGKLNKRLDKIDQIAEDLAGLRALVSRGGKR